VWGRRPAADGTAPSRLFVTFPCDMGPTSICQALAGKLAMRLSRLNWANCEGLNGPPSAVLSV